MSRRDPRPDPGEYLRPSQITSRLEPNQTPEDRALVHNRYMFGDVGEAVADELDSRKVRKMHARLMGHYLTELERQAPWRMRMARDEAMYDSDQWEPDDAAILKDRGQEALVLNVIAQSINWITGSQRRARTDYRILPRRKEGAPAAERKSQLLKFIADASKSQFAYSDSFEQAVKAGLSWLESGVQDDTEGAPVFERHESWRNIVWDSHARERDLSDARYIFRTRWMDPDDAAAMFPKRTAQILNSASMVNEFGAAADRFGDDPMDEAEVESTRSSYAEIEPGDFTRERVRMIEAWFKVPEETQVIAGGDFAGEVYDEDSAGHREQVEAGFATIKSRTLYRIHVMIMTPHSVIWFGKSPYRHNRMPFTPMWCYRKSGTGEPYGIVRNMVDAQKDINKRFSKALAILSSNKTVMDEGAVADLDEYAEEIANPNAIIVKRPGKELKIDADRELAPAHLQIMQMSMQMIQTLSGVTDEAMGKTTNAVSGRAIMARQEQGVVSTATAFDHLRSARQYHGEKLLSLTEQFISDQMEFRITNSRGQPDYVTINSGEPSDDITRTKADYVISEDDWNSTLRQSQVQQLMEMLTQLAPGSPQIVMVLLDLIIEAMDVPSRDEIVKRVRSITGMEDPDADPNTPDPERQAREQQKAMQAEMEMRAAQANLAKLEGEAAKVMAVAEKEAANAARLLMSMPGESLEQKRKALELAIAMLTGPPGAVDTADALLVQEAPAPASAAPQPPAMPPEAPMGGNIPPPMAAPI
jgi:hypothetical protein